MIPSKIISWFSRIRLSTSVKTNSPPKYHFIYLFHPLLRDNMGTLLQPLLRSHHILSMYSKSPNDRVFQCLRHNLRIHCACTFLQYVHHSHIYINSYRSDSYSSPIKLFFNRPPGVWPSPLVCRAMTMLTQATNPRPGFPVVLDSGLEPESGHYIQLVTADIPLRHRHM